MTEAIILIIILIIAWGAIWIDLYTYSLTDRKHCQHCDKHFCAKQHEQQKNITTKIPK